MKSNIHHFEYMHSQKFISTIPETNIGKLADNKVHEDFCNARY